MTAISKRPPAYNDLAEIWCYVAENSNEKLADKLIDRFEAKATLLAKSAKMGKSRPELMASLRSFAVGKYVIIYLSVKNGIEIVRVLHSARDINSLFAGENDADGEVEES